MIPFNRPYFTGRELDHVREAMLSGHVSGDGKFSRQCEAYFEKRYGFHRGLLTTSCTDALEMAALLCEIAPGDEVILPSFTFVSTANAFALRGARLRFVDSLPDSPNIDTALVEPLITPRTRALVAVHYAGVACDMDPLLTLAAERGLRVVEDAAQGVEATYKGRPLGSLGELATFSFHETKNIHCGEGGLLAVNREGLAARAEILGEKGTNRSAFFRGETDKYGWVDLGSSFLPSDLLAAVLWGQIEELESIQARRMALWERYRDGLAELAERHQVGLPSIPEFAGHNAHLFYLVVESLARRTALIAHLKRAGFMAVFHYQSLHQSAYFRGQHDGRPLPHADTYSDCLLRLPLFVELTESQQDGVIEAVLGFFRG